MRERLSVHLRGLPQIVESWNRLENPDPQPSQFARSLTKVATCIHQANQFILFSIEVPYCTLPLVTLYVCFLYRVKLRDLSFLFNIEVPYCTLHN